MKQTRVSSHELLSLADEVSRMATRAGHISQTPVQQYLNAALVDVLEGAKIVAFHEARERHQLTDTQLAPSELPSGAEGEKR